MCRFTTSPCVRSKSLRVYRQNARMCSTCAHFAGTHGVSYTEGFFRVEISFFFFRGGSRRIRRSALPAGPFPQRALSKYATLSIDNLVSLIEQQFVDSVSQRAEELKPLGHERLPHFSPNPVLVQNRIRGFRSVDVSALFVFLNSEESVTAHAC